MNTFGNRIKLTVFGQSHAKALGVTIDGLPAGVPIDYEYIESIMRLRAPGNLDISTKRSEPDKVEFISGVVNGKTVGTSVCAVYSKYRHHFKRLLVTCRKATSLSRRLSGNGKIRRKLRFARLRTVFRTNDSLIMYSRRCRSSHS